MSEETVSNTSIGSEVGGGTPTGASENDYQQVLNQAQANSFANAEQNLSRRAEEKLNYSASNISVEQELATVQKQIYALQYGPQQDHLQLLQLQNQAQLLAERLTSSGFSQDDFDSRFDEREGLQTDYSAAEDINGKYGAEAVSQTLQWAVEGLSEEVSDAFNSALEANDESSTQAFEVLRQLQHNPEFVNKGDHNNFINDPAITGELVEQYGAPGKILAAISNGLGTGRLTRAQAAQMVLKDPQVAMAAISAARQNLITLSL